MFGRVTSIRPRDDGARITLDEGSDMELPEKVDLDWGGATIHDRRGGVRVTLRDGRAFVLDGSNDVDENNEGILVLEDGSETSLDHPEASWVLVRWRDFGAVRFEVEGGI